MTTVSNEYTPTCAETANFSHKLLLTNTQVSGLHKAFANAVPASANVKTHKTHISKIVQSAGILGRLLGPLMKTVYHWLSICFNHSLRVFWYQAAAAAADAGIHKKMLWSCS